MDIEYEYHHHGASYIGTKIYPFIPNVFDSKKLATEIIDSLQTESNVTVYFDPSSPDQSALITSDKVSLKALAIIVASIIVVALFIFGGVYFFRFE